jgi:hypothetical protein
MDLIDRYLAAVGVLLPRDQRDDIVAELRDVLETHADEKRAELGRALTVEEESELLRAFGHPLAVAGRYGRRQYLIGPELYPLYVVASKVVLAIAAASALVAGAVAAALFPGDWGAVVRAALSAIWHGAVGTMAGLTVTAAVLERYNIRLKFLTQWNPGDLPEAARWRLFRSPTRFEHVAAILIQGAFILWWIRVAPVGLPYLTSIPLAAGQHLDLAPAAVWRTLFWPVLGLALVAVALHVARLIGQGRQAYARPLALLEHVGAVAISLIALRAGHWVEVSGAGLPAGALAKVGYGVNLGLQLGLVALLVVAASLALRDAWGLYANRRRPA